MAPETLGFLTGIVVSVPALYFISKKAFDVGQKNGIEIGVQKAMAMKISKMMGVRVDTDKNGKTTNTPVSMEEMMKDFKDADSVKIDEASFKKLDDLFK